MTAPPSRRGLLAQGAGLGAGLLGGAAVPRAMAQPAAGPAAPWPTPWPSRPVRLVVGFTAGSSTDVTGRIFAQRFSEAWGQPVVVENIPGNGGAIGLDRVARAAPDGHTLMWAGNGAVTIVPSLQPLPFDPLKDLVSIGITLSMPSLILANAATPWRSLPELVAHARANPGRVSFGTPGVGTPQHIVGEMLCHQAGIRMEHIPYRGANLADLLSGAVPVGIQNAGASLPLVREGRVRCLGVTSLTRSANAPELPTVAEQGYPGFEALSWFGLMAPAGTPPGIIRTVHAAAIRVLADGDMRARFAALGLDAVGGSPEAMRETIAADIPKWARVIAEAGIPVAR
ncbi:tripartite tricarboxylate transporter substrate binding protein [Paeniroseomonas aquatica]|uniref:Tripartite tricarboxylate transporter substrate binding protein n=1 Tax=Paeniroseomonas aquatica TaxID=373043 RepID=A0ABT8A0I8_9PROT|nr:tripartite tricarboxylate transporter substrate binding protein [Paeniroseomonas aquatica]MDN3563054.1 tripartite tricarboxylate transporter substrate binding protein [Paeniroseomonas aquatica]